VGQASIFLVEDEALIRMALATMVEDLGHRVVLEAATIADAGAYAMTGVFDLAILDINIGGYGIDPVADVIEKRGLPFFFITGYGTAHLPSLFRRRPVLEKPVDTNKLKAMIDRLLP
jgi:DNA-binding NtrC family response regulator